MKKIRQIGLIGSICSSLALALAFGPLRGAEAHEIYTGLRGPTGLLCCGGSDCAATKYRLKGQKYEFRTKENEWVDIPSARIQFLPVPGDEVSSEEEADHRAHLCYRKASEADRQVSPENVFGEIYLYCAFIPPGSG